MSTVSKSFLFISHVSANRTEAMAIASQLEKRGIRCWIAPRDVRPAQPFDTQIANAIANCRALLLVFTGRCNDNEYILREVTVAGDHGKMVIPLRMEDVEPAHGLQVRLAGLHRIDGFASREQALAQALDKVADAISGDVPEPGAELPNLLKTIGGFHEVYHWAISDHTPYGSQVALGRPILSRALLIIDKVGDNGTTLSCRITDWDEGKVVFDFVGDISPVGDHALYFVLRETKGREILIFCTYAWATNNEWYGVLLGLTGWFSGAVERIPSAARVALRYLGPKTNIPMVKRRCSVPIPRWVKETQQLEDALIERIGGWVDPSTLTPRQNRAGLPAMIANINNEVPAGQLPFALRMRLPR